MTFEDVECLRPQLWQIFLLSITLRYRGIEKAAKRIFFGIKVSEKREQSVLGALTWPVWFFDLKNFLEGSLSLIKSLLPEEEPAEPVHSHFLTPAEEET